MSLLERALRIGENKQFKRFLKQVDLIGAYAEELELESDAELRARFDALRQEAENGARLTICSSRCFRSPARWVAAR